MSNSKKSTSHPIRIGADVGGTFTDVALVDEASGEVFNGKVLSTPQDPSRGFMEAVQRLVEQGAIAPEAATPR